MGNIYSKEETSGSSDRERDWAHPIPFCDNASISNASILSESNPSLAEQLYDPAEESSQESFKRSNSNSSLSDDSGAHSDDAELDTYFRCPCGRTDFPHCLYPPPMCLDNRHSNTQGFPELDLSHGADNESRVQQRMDERLVAETTTIRNEYMRFGMAVRNWVQSINQIESILMTLVQLQGQPHANFSSFDELFRAVIVNADYINHEALKIVVEECRRQGSNDELYAVVQVAEEKFDQAFCKFARQRVFSLPGGLEELPLPTQQGVYKELKLKIEENYTTFTMERLMYFKKVVKKVLHLPEQIILRLTSVNEGCVQITFQVIGTVSNKIFELTPSQKNALIGYNITMIECNGCVLYCCCDLFKDEEALDVINQVYQRVRLTALPRNVTEQQLLLEEHSSDCPHIKKENCAIEMCSSCAKQMHHCSLEYHALRCSNDAWFWSYTSSEFSDDDIYSEEENFKNCLPQPRHPFVECDTKNECLEGLVKQAPKKSVPFEAHSGPPGGIKASMRTVCFLSVVIALAAISFYLSSSSSVLYQRDVMRPTKVFRDPIGLLDVENVNHFMLKVNSSRRQLLNYSSSKCTLCQKNPPITDIDMRRARRVEIDVVKTLLLTKKKLPNVYITCKFRPQPDEPSFLQLNIRSTLSLSRHPIIHVLLDLLTSTYEQRMDRVRNVWMKGIGLMEGSITTELGRTFNDQSCKCRGAYTLCYHKSKLKESISLKASCLTIMHGLLDMLFHLGAHAYWPSKHFQESTRQLRLIIKTTQNKRSPLSSRRDFACYTGPSTPDRLFLSVIQFHWWHSNNCDCTRSLGNLNAVLPPHTHVPSSAPYTTNFKSKFKHHEHHFQLPIHISTSYHVKTSFCTKKHVLSPFRRWALFLTSLSLTPPPILSISQIHVQSSHVVLLALMCLTYSVFFWSQPYFQN